MELLEQFNVYLKKWCKDNHKPLPSLDNVNKYWQQAWESFLKEELVGQWEERKEMFNDIKLLKRRDLYNKPFVEVTDDELEEPKEAVDEPETSWQRVQKYLKKS